MDDWPGVSGVFMHIRSQDVLPFVVRDFPRVLPTFSPDPDLRVKKLLAADRLVILLAA